MPVSLVKLSAVSFCRSTIWGLLTISTLMLSAPPPPTPPPPQPAQAVRLSVRPVVAATSAALEFRLRTRPPPSPLTASVDWRSNERHDAQTSTLSKSAQSAPVNGKDGHVNDDGPAELVMLAAVARRHYLQNQSKVEIADELGISRFKVARMLESARERGLVRIEIVRQGSLDVDLSARLQQRFDLAHAVVVDTADADPGAVRHQLGRAAADLLSEVLVDGDVLGPAVVAQRPRRGRGAHQPAPRRGRPADRRDRPPGLRQQRRRHRPTRGPFVRWQGTCLLCPLCPRQQIERRCAASSAGRRGRPGAGLGGDEGGRRASAPGRPGSPRSTTSSTRPSSATSRPAA